VLHYWAAHKFPDVAEYFLSKGADGLTCFVVQPVSAGGLDVSKVDRM
jgi:UDP-N-acetylenolpyruvoylglucosamine reductase